MNNCNMVQAMYHQHFESVNSTQLYLKNHLDELKLIENDILISCSQQTEGVGRRGSSWDTYPNSLAMSFTIKPNSTPSLTPLEIGILVVDFFRQYFKKELFLKWPNDILTDQGKKCGGILSQYIDNNTVIVGLGINLGRHDKIIQHVYRYAVGSVDDVLELSAFDQKKISQELYQYILNQRILETTLLKKRFKKYCYHIEKEVFIYDEGVDHVGIFKGIGDNGEALIETNSQVKAFLSSSLTILD